MKFSSALKLNHIFRRLYGTSGHANGYLVLYARKNRTGANRVGITVSKKLGGAVVRNRTRRRLREVYRLNEEAFAAGTAADSEYTEDTLWAYSKSGPGKDKYGSLVKVATVTLVKNESTGQILAFDLIKFAPAQNG